MRRLAVATAAVFSILVFESCNNSGVQLPKTDEVVCTLSGQKCQTQTVPQGTLLCAPDGDVKMDSTTCKAANMTAVAACMDACRGLPWASCSVVVKSETDNSPNCTQRSGSQSALAEQNTPQIGNDLAINVAPQTKISINSPTLNESVTTVITSGQIVLSVQKSPPSSGDRMSRFSILKDFRITLNDIPFCFASNKTPQFNTPKKQQQESKDASNCEHRFSNIEITNNNIAALIPNGDDPREVVLPAGAATFEASFLIDDQPSLAEIPLTEDLVIQFKNNRKRAKLSGNLDFLFGAILLNVILSPDGQ